jgi:hypothetical protein
MRLLLDIYGTPDGRLEGRIGSDGADTWMSFSGVLELLKVLEGHTSISIDGGNRSDAEEGTES